MRVKNIDAQSLERAVLARLRTVLRDQELVEPEFVHLGQYREGNPEVVFDKFKLSVILPVRPLDAEKFVRELEISLRVHGFILDDAATYPVFYGPNNKPGIWLELSNTDNWRSVYWPTQHGLSQQ
jgi:hypothetical protein